MKEIPNDPLTKAMLEFNELEFKFAKWKAEIYDALNKTHNSEKFREDICEFQETRYSAYMLFFLKRSEVNKDPCYPTEQCACGEENCTMGKCRDCDKIYDACTCWDPSEGKKCQDCLEFFSDCYCIGIR